MINRAGPWLLSHLPKNQHLVVATHMWHNHILLYLIKYNPIQNLLAIETNLVYISTRCDIDSDEV